nr:hypothetical protein CFP56_72980 [Quercus suber]
MIPASSNRAGWSLFQKELRNFFFGAKPISLAKVSLYNAGEGGKLVGGGWSGKVLSVYEGESSSMRRGGDPKPSVLATELELDRGASTLTIEPVHIVSVVSPSTRALGVTKSAKLGFIGKEI